MREIKISILLFITLSLLTGFFYPMAVTVPAQFFFPLQATGSLIYSSDGTPIGSAVIGQSFSEPEYFWPRPSATSDFPYNALASGGSNLGPNNKKLINQIAERVKTLKVTDIHGYIPSDLVMASGSGLDPHISPQAALIQVSRIAKKRNISEEKVRSLVRNCLEGRQFGFLGAPRVNVLKLNLALDEL